MKIYDIKVKTIDDTESTLKQYEKKVLLIVNTATGCGFTPQYEGLQKLYDKYQEKGLEILDFPCNQFGSQAPGTIKEINSFCSLNYGTTFPRFAKVDVNGENEAPIYKYLKSKKKGLLVSKIKWNFTKFLVDREGNIIKRYAPTYSPSKIEKDILKLL